MQILSKRFLPLLALLAALPAWGAESSSRELSFFTRAYDADFTGREISIWTGDSQSEFASRELSFYFGSPQEFASREVSLNLFGSLELAEGFIGHDFAQLPDEENYWMSLAPARPGAGDDPNALYFTVAGSLWGDPGDDPDDLLYRARLGAPLELLNTFPSADFDPIGSSLFTVPGFGDKLYIASAHFGADEGVEEGGGLVRYDLDSGDVTVLTSDTLVVKSPQRFDIVDAQGSFLRGLYGTNLGAGVDEAFAVNAMGTPLAFAVDHTAPILCARMAEPGDFGGLLHLGSEDGIIYSADAFGALSVFSADLGSPVEALDFGKSGLFAGYLYALLRDGRVMRLDSGGGHEQFASGLLPGMLAKGPARNDLRFSWEGAELFVTDVLRSRIYAIRSDVEVGVDEGAQVPGLTALHGNYPNPFNPKTTIRFSLAQSEKVDLSIYSVTGRRIRRLADGAKMGAGVYELEWDGRDEGGGRVATGVYFAKLRAGDASFTRKMVLLK